ncbi:Alpha-mannosidase [Hyella patelloides LEGE 07179]|uniref:Alpha-mannosidase n=1 Tax=Hyella patelloides LEGE 07179 TaxID=945734 RepID=A0A563W4V5_9CYAN|nr:alpha-mannosidase [Hyella patelloides]VEP18696.1 Alpha-mannosidase [Hyella patelloides LEGE 07179]
MTNSNLEKINEIIELLQQLTQLDIQESWYCHIEENIQIKPEEYLTTIDFNRCQKISLNEKRYIVFPQGRQVRWLLQKIVIPNDLQQYPLSGLTLRLVLTWWAEDAQIFINGKLVQQGDLFDSSARVLITDNAVPQQEFLIAIRLVSPNHDIGALMRAHLLYEKDNTPHEIDPGWVSKEIAVLSKYLTEFEPHKLEILIAELSQIDGNLITDTQEFDNCLNNLRQRLLPLATNIKQRNFNLLGHAHLDMAWLWSTAETYEVAQRTFTSVLTLQQKYPNLTFCHTSPALYQWIETNRPDLFKAIQKAIKANKWEALGGMWIEPEVNLISGESIIRQLLYGQQYFKTKFGHTTRVAWLPDSFGFPWQFPQLLKQCGIDYFVTGKLHWNDTTKFPHGCFWWESPDGTRLFTLMSPPNVTGVMDTNPITMTNYALEWESQTGLQDIFWLPGVGDHGGGPTRDMLDVAQKWQQSPFFPEIEFTTATEYLDKVAQSDNNYCNDERLFASTHPTYNSELSLELHRGCYTIHGDQKKFNRYCENLLYQAELFATLAILTDKGSLHSALFSHYKQNIGKKQESQVPSNKNNSSLNDSNYQNSQQDLSWQQQIEIAWKKVLFNQFHDILPGTSIPEVFTEANEQWQEAISIGETILEQSLSTIASLIQLPSPPEPNAKPIVVFNALNWTRSQIVSIPIEQEYCQVYDLEDNLILTQITSDNQLQFLAQDISSVGYRVYWLLPQKVPIVKRDWEEKNFTLENQYLKIKINSQTGDIDSIYDKIALKEILSDKGNQLQAFTDKGQYWDAWNIDPEYEQKQLSPATLKSIQWLENGTIQQTIRVIRIIGKSKFIQDYILAKHSPILKIATTVDWQETHVLVKAAFPLTIESDYATSEIACGAIKRPTKPQTAAEKAKWETSALKWVDLTDEQQNYGVSLLNDCKYGYDIKPNQIRITLLRSPVWPDSNSDRGKHQFTYAVYPHKGSWQQAKTVHHSYELNLLLQVAKIDREKQTNAYLSPVGSFINLSADNLILMAIKPFSQSILYQDRKVKKDVILRCYECHGETAKLDLKGDLYFSINSEINCLEEDTNQKVNTVINPWKIKIFQLNMNQFYQD